MIECIHHRITENIEKAQYKILDLSAQNNRPTSPYTPLHVGGE